MTAVATMGLTACDSGDDGGSGSPGPFDERAAQVAEAWRSSGAIDTWRSVPVLLEDPTWVSAFDANWQSVAFNDGRISADGGLSAGPATGSMVAADGTATRVRLVGARDAIDAMRGSRRKPPACGGPNVRCRGLVVTTATLVTMEVRTSRGRVTVPTWRFTVDTMRHPILRVAVDPADLAAEPEVPVGDAPRETVGALELVDRSGDGRTVDYTIGVGACDTDIRAALHEEDDIVVVGGAVTRPDVVCTAQLLAHPVTITLDRPLGDRPLVDVRSGRALRPAPRPPAGG